MLEISRLFREQFRFACNCHVSRQLLHCQWKMWKILHTYTHTYIYIYIYIYMYIYILKTVCIATDCTNQICKRIIIGLLMTLNWPSRDQLSRCNVSVYVHMSVLVVLVMNYLLLIDMTIFSGWECIRRFYITQKAACIAGTCSFANSYMFPKLVLNRSLRAHLKRPLVHILYLQRSPVYKKKHVQSVLSGSLLSCDVTILNNDLNTIFRSTFHFFFLLFLPAMSYALSQWLILLTPEI